MQKEEGRMKNSWAQESSQFFTVPGAATRLFLGFLEGPSFNGYPGYYDDNGGQLTASFQVQAIPEPQSLAMILLGLVAAVSVERLRR